MSGLCIKLIYHAGRYNFSSPATKVLHDCLHPYDVIASMLAQYLKSMARQQNIFAFIQLSQLRKEYFKTGPGLVVMGDDS